MVVYLLFFIGFALLIKGADLLIENAKILGVRFGVPTIIIGLTVVAFGTSLPEMVVNVFASLSGSSELIIGNIVGSNISNTLLILGVAALIFPLKAQRTIVRREIPFAVLSVLAVGASAADVWLDGELVSQLTRTDGLALLGFFLIFLYASFGGGLDSDEEKLSRDEKSRPIWLIILWIVLGLAGLTLGGKWIVDGATVIALELGLSQTIIGLTIVAIGTSLPELAASAVAAYKQESDIAIGNVIGSNVFNVLFVLGVNASIAPVVFQTEHFIDWGVMLVSAMLLFAIMFVGKKHTIDRWQGGVFVLLYCAYLTVRVWVV